MALIFSLIIILDNNTVNIVINHKFISFIMNFLKNLALKKKLIIKITRY